MDFRQIEAFVFVYRLRNFSRAGDALFLTQPTVSSHINSLESELGMKLLDRSSRDVTPTEAGDIFYQYAVNLLETRDSAICSLNQYSSRIEGRLEIAASTIPSQYLLPRIIKGFREIYPNIHFILHQCDTREVIRDLQEKKYQIGIVGTHLEDDKLEYDILSSDKLILISAKDKETDNKTMSRVPLESLQDKHFIIREPGSGTRQEFEKELRNKGFNPDTLKIAAEINSIEAIKYAVREGLGVSVVSSLSVEDDIKLGLIQAYSIEGLDLERCFYLVTHKNRPLSPCAAVFREYILKYYHDLIS